LDNFFPNKFEKGTKAHQSQSSFQSVLGFDEPLFKATPHNSRLAA
jgi:hypothetical protein